MKRMKKTIIENIDEAISRFPDKNALTWLNEKPISYKELGERYREIANILKNQGIRHSDKVAILSENSPNWAISYIAIVSLGAVVVPILTEFHENEIHHILRHSEAKAIFVSNKLFPKFETMFGAEKDIIAINIDHFTIITPPSTLDKLKVKLLDRRDQVIDKTGILGEIVGWKHKQTVEEDLAVIIYTSGTTGQSKGVMLTHKNLITNIKACYSLQPMDENDKLISILPLPHTYESTLGFLYPLMFNCEITYLKRPPTASVLLPALAKVRPTIMLTVPLIMEKIFKNKIYATLTSKPILRFFYSIPMIRVLLHNAAGKKLYKTFGGRLKFYGIGGAKVAADVEKFLQDCNFPYSIGYGLTETSPLIAGTSPAKTKYRSTGPVVYNLLYKLINQNPETGEGEVVVKGDSVMKGYYKDEKATKDAFTEDGYFRTGDLAVLRKGFLFIKGRLKNVIIGSSGENIFPEEIESIINENEYVVESLVLQQDSKLVAQIHLDYDYIDKMHSTKNSTEAKLKKEIDQILLNLKVEVNSKVSGFSKIFKCNEQTVPFEKTPTMKIKRYLYN
ncbi:MAG: AMP-binding protein [Candidatus Cloacimonadales bacterium]